MKAIGIVAEYNPFHTGHAFHIRETRRLFQENTAVVAVMSGNWVQRGDCAVLDKWTRARAALEGGVDLVLELPTVYAVSSAEGFARGAVSILEATGIIDILSFGSECGQIAPLRELAQSLNSPEFSSALRRDPGSKQPFALCRRQAAEQLLGPGKAALLDFPNNNLGVEYLRFLPPDIEAVTVPRRGAGHDGGAHPTYPSASFLREKIQAGELPSENPASLSHCERAVLARLRTMGPEDWSALPDSGMAEGLPQRLATAAIAASSLADFYALVKTKRYAHARIRRLALWAFLGLNAADRPELPPYLRVLGFNAQGRDILREMKHKASLPILTKPAHGKGLPLLELEARCTDLYGLCCETVLPGGLEWTTGPVIIKQ